MFLRSLGWALSLFAAVGSLLIYFVDPAGAWRFFLVSGLLAVAFFVVAQVFDVLARDDLDRRQTRAWLLVVVLGAPPVGAVAYRLLGRRRTAAWLAPPAPQPDEARRVVHWAYAVGDPFHRERSLTARAGAAGSPPDSSPRTPPTRRT